MPRTMFTDDFICTAYSAVLMCVHMWFLESRIIARHTARQCEAKCQALLLAIETENDVQDVRVPGGEDTFRDC